MKPRKARRNTLNKRVGDISRKDFIASPAMFSTLRLKYPEVALEIDRKLYRSWKKALGKDVEWISFHVVIPPPSQDEREDLLPAICHYLYRLQFRFVTIGGPYPSKPNGQLNLYQFKAGI